jgi:hypothetical protein
VGGEDGSFFAAAIGGPGIDGCDGLHFFAPEVRLELSMKTKSPSALASLAMACTFIAALRRGPGIGGYEFDRFPGKATAPGA